MQAVFYGLISGIGIAVDYITVARQHETEGDSRRFLEIRGDQRRLRTCYSSIVRKWKKQ